MLWWQAIEPQCEFLYFFMLKKSNVWAQNLASLIIRLIDYHNLLSNTVHPLPPTSSVSHHIRDPIFRDGKLHEIPLTSVHHISGPRILQLKTWKFMQPCFTHQPGPPQPIFKLFLTGRYPPLEGDSYHRYVPHNDVSVNDGLHMRRWSHKIIIPLCYNCLQYWVQQHAVQVCSLGAIGCTI